jgi:thiol-disulfide isomerase/thioredoxin
MRGDWLRATGLCWLLAAVLPASAEVLTWTHGDEMEGEWLGLENGRLKWQAADLAAPVQLALPHLHQWRARPTGSVVITEKMARTGRLTLQDGSLFAADLKPSNSPTENWQVDTALAGPLTLRAAAVRDWLRLSPAGPLQFAGPAGFTGFTFSNRGKLPGQSWQTAPSGELLTQSIDQSITLPMALPEKLRIDIWLHSRQVNTPPSFQLKIRREGQAAELETWLGECVALGAQSAVSVRTLYEAPFAAVLCLDFSAAQATVYDLQGKRLASWEVRGRKTKPAPTAAAKGKGGLLGALAQAVVRGMVPEPTSQPSTGEVASGLVLVNSGASLALQRLILREWDGQPPQPRNLTEPFVETLDGNVHPGRVIAFQESTIQLADKSLPLDQVLWIHTPSQPSSVPSEPTIQEPTPGCWLEATDGSFFHGDLAQSDAQHLRLSANWSLGELSLPKAKLVSATWYVPDPNIGPPTLNTNHLDRWISERGKRTLHGFWQPTTGSTPHWCPVGAEQAVPIKDTGTHTFLRAISPASGSDSQLPEIAHLESGEAVPIDLQSWTEKTAHIKVPLAVTDAGQSLPLTEVRALELSGPTLRPDGFSDPHWSQTLGRPTDLSLSDDRQTLTLMPGTRYAHGSFLQGEQLTFSIGGESTYGTLRLRLFCQGSDEKSAHVAVLVACYHGTIYCGVEDAENPGQMVGNTNRITVPKDQPSQMQLNWTSKQLRVQINNTLVFTQNLTHQSQSGTGLLLEPASLWGNESSEVVISNLKLKPTAGARSRPAVDADVKQWALQVPRRLADDPPRHFLVGQNGDVLRGTLQQINSRLLTLRSGLELLEVPRARVAMLILPRTDSKPTPKPPASPTASAQKWWLTTTQSAALHWKITAFGPTSVEGVSAVLGPCRIPVSQVVSLSTEPPPNPAPTFADWKWTAAPDPVLPTAATGATAKAIGTAAPAFELDLVSGGSFRPADAKGKVLVLDFWATWCGPCLKAMPEIMATLKDLPPDQVQLIAVNQAQPKQEVATFLTTRGWDLTVALDLDQKVGKLYGVEGIPHTVVIGPDGKIAWSKVGYTPTAAKELREAIQKLLP